MRQKFRKLTFVKVCDEMPPHMFHFPAGFIGIVAGTYSQLYGGGDRALKQYSLFAVENGRIVNRLAWYDEEHLTALDEQNRLKAEEMVEDYMTRRQRKGE